MYLFINCFQCLDKLFNIKKFFNFIIVAVFATGARDGTIMIWDTRANHSGQPKPDNIITNAHVVKQQKVSQSVTALTFQDDETLISTSAGDGYSKLIYFLQLKSYLI